MRFLLLASIALPLLLTPARAQLGNREYRAAVRAMDGAAREFDIDRFLDALEVVLQRDDPGAIRDAADAYGELLAKGGDELSDRRFYVLHGKAARSFSSVANPRAIAEMKHQQKVHGRWRARLLLLDAASFNEHLNVGESALVALDDKQPAVVRRALTYLSRVRTRAVVEAIVERYLSLARERKSGGDPEWSRTELAFQGALARLVRIELPAAEDYRNYVSSRRDDDDLFTPPHARAGGRTELTLFGVSVTGSNVTFILDTSGSMLSTDRLPEAQLRRRRARTGVIGADGAKRVLEDRRRIVRAKKELARVVKALPEGVHFNIIAFSSTVEPWSDRLVEATPANKKKALEFIGSMSAFGITVMDLALEEALADLSVDTIYLITDGAPTHVGSQGGLPPDAPELMKSILRRVKVINFLRGVRIFTLGFRGAEEDFLKELSAAHAGKYKRID